jgi:large subunit ribosomal protein L4
MATEKSITVVEDFNFDAVKTKSYVDFLSNLKLSDKKTLLVLNEQDKNIYLSSRNLGSAKVVIASELNTYGILNANNLLLTESAIAIIEKSLS